MKARVEKQDSDILFLKHLTESLRSQIKALEEQTSWKDIKDKSELIKENAELKEKLGDIQMQKAGEKSDLVWKLKTANEQKDKQLTKAKELLKRLMHELVVSNRPYNEVELLVKDVEQFLNSEVEK